MRTPLCLVLCLLATTLPHSASANIWDNLFSQYSSPLVPLTAPTSMKFELQQFTLLFPLFLRVDYYGPDNAIAFTLGKEEVDGGTVLLDFKHGFVRAEAAKTPGRLVVGDGPRECVYRELPTAMRADITDLNNLLRYFSYEEKPTSGIAGTKVYRLNLLGLESKLLPFWSGTSPKVQIRVRKNAQNEFTQIDLLLGESTLTLKRSAKDLSAVTPPPAVRALDKSTCVEAHSLQDLLPLRSQLFHNLFGQQLDLFQTLFSQWFAPN